VYSVVRQTLEIEKGTLSLEMFCLYQQKELIMEKPVRDVVSTLDKSDDLTTSHKCF